MTIEKNKPIQKEHFTIRVEAMVPVTLLYKVYAESPEQAVDKVRQGYAALYEAPKLALNRARYLRASVYSAGTSIIRWVKSFT